MTDKEQIIALYKEMYAAMVNKDRAELERVHDDSFVLVADYDNIVRELQKVSGDHGELLKAGL